MTDAELEIIAVLERSRGAPLTAEEIWLWQSLRSVSEKARAVLKAVEVDLSAVDDDVNLSPEGKQAKRIAVAKKAISNLQEIKPGDAVARRMTGLRNKIENDRKDGAPPKDSSISTEIRNHIRSAGGHGKSIMEALKLKDDKRHHKRSENAIDR